MPLAPQLRGSEAITRLSAMAAISARHVPSPPAARRAQRPVGQGERIVLRRPVVQLYPADDQDVRRPRIQDEGLVQGDGSNRRPFRAEPASSRDLAPVESFEGQRDVLRGPALRGPDGPADVLRS